MLSSLMRLMHVRPFRGKMGPEDRLAVEVASYLRAASLEGRLLGTWTHIPHEVGGGTVTARVRYALAKAMGLISGSADYVFVWPSGGGWIELKSVSGSLNPSQRDFRDWAMATGCNWACCKTLDDVVETLVGWGALRAC